MILEFDLNGLPKPGRELDAAVWGMLGYEVEEKQVWSIESLEWEQCLCYCAEDGAWRIVPAISTTTAFFQVMEAMEIRLKPGDGWHMMDYWDRHQDTGSWHPRTRASYVKDGKWAQAAVLGEGKTLEERHAHAVCAAVVALK
jgi:hypothetical protein